MYLLVTSEAEFLGPEIKRHGDGVMLSSIVSRWWEVSSAGMVEMVDGSVWVVRIGRDGPGSTAKEPDLG